MFSDTWPELTPVSEWMKIKKNYFHPFSTLSLSTSEFLLLEGLGKMPKDCLGYTCPENLLSHLKGDKGPVA